MANLQGKLSDINMVIFNGQECKLVHFDDACTWADKYSLTIPQLPVGVGSCEVTRVSSQATLATKGKIAVGSATSETNVDIYYSDVLSATATEGRGFNAPTVTLSETNVTNNVTANIERGAPKATTLSWSAKPTGVASFSLVALRSPYEGWVSESDPINLTLDGKAGSQTVYFGDEFGVEATAETGYGTPKLNVGSSFTVDLSPISITVEAGATKEYQMTIPAFGPAIKSVTVKKNGTTVATGKQYEIVYFKANHFDTLTLEVVSAEGYEASTYKSSWYITGPTTFDWSEPDVKQYKLKKVVSGNGVKDYVVTRTHSPLGSGTTGSLSDGATLFYGDILTQSANPVTGYYNPGFNWTNKTITVNDSNANSNKEITSTVTGSGVIKSKLIINALPTGVESITVRRTYSGLQGAGLGTLVNNDDIYYGDTLAATATASPGYYSPKNVKPVAGTSVLDQNITASAEAGDPITYKLSISAPNATVTVQRTSSPIKNTTGTLSHNADIWYGDKLKITASANTGYSLDGLYVNGTQITSGSTITVSGNVEIGAPTTANGVVLKYPAKPEGAYYTIMKYTTSTQTEVVVQNPSTAGEVILPYGTVVFVDYGPTNTTYWNNPTVSWSDEKILTGDTNFIIYHSPKSCKLTCPATPSGVASYTISRTFTYSVYSETGVIKPASTTGADSITVYYGDKLTISATAASGYTDPSASLSQTTVTNLSGVTATVTRGYGIYKLTISTASQANTHTVTRTSSKVANTGALSNGATIYEGDTLTAGVTAKTGYKTPSIDWTSKTVSGNVTSTTTNNGALSYTLTKGSTPTGVSSFTVSRTSSPYQGAGTGALSNGATIYYGDKLTASASATTGYNNPTLSWSSLTVDGNESCTVTAGSVKSYTLTISPAGHASSHTVTRTSSPLKGASTGTLSNGATIYYGDTLTASTTGADPYYTPTLNWTSTTVTGNVTSSGTNVGIKAYTLTISAKPTGVASHTVTRTSSPYASASTGNLSSGATIYYGDKLSQTATAATDYLAPSVNWSSRTVSSNLTATATAGPYAYVTLYYSACPTGGRYEIFSVNTSTGNTTPIVTNPTSNGSVRLNYGTYLRAAYSVTDSTVYQVYGAAWSEIQATSNVEFGLNVDVKNWTLSKSSNYGVSSHTVSRTSSPYKGASTGSLSDGATIYYGDKLSQSASASSGYTVSVNWSTTTVTGKVTATATATKEVAKVQFGLDTPYAVYSVPAGTTWGSWTSADGNPYGQMYRHVSDMVAPAEGAANAGIFILHPNGYPVFWNETIKAELYITGTPQD